jgi:hypothetical protein
MTSGVRHVRVTALAVAAIVAITAAAAVAGGIKITIQRDKAYQFEGRHTYAWHPEQSGDVKVLQAMGDPAKIKEKFEPMILPVAEAELAKRGFTKVPADKADFYVNYYILLGPNYTAQYHGQFVGAIPEWGLPDFLQSTSSLKVIEQGSVVLDVTSTALKTVIWRGIAAAEFKGNLSDAERQARINKGITDMLKAFPPKDEKPKAEK